MRRTSSVVVLASVATIAFAVFVHDGSTPGPEPLRVNADAGALVPEIATAFPVGRGRAMTVAHVLGGARHVRVGRQPARVLRVDPELDLAVLAVPGLPNADVRTSQDGGHAHIRVLRDGQQVSVPTAIRRRVMATVTSPASGTTQVRPALELDATVLPGDSGAPVVDDAGHLLGVVFARADAGKATAWAVEARPRVARLIRGS